MSSQDPNRLSALNTHWHNRSLSSITSDAATFHSAHAHMELSRLETPRPHSSATAANPRPESPTSTARPLSPTSTPLPPSPLQSRKSPILESSQMSRQDSGFSDGLRSTTSISSRRTSTSSTSRDQKRKRCSGRPSTKRATRSSPTTAQIGSSSKRPPISSRHTTPAPYEFRHQFTQFPILDPSPPSSSQHPTAETEVMVPPPQTCQYWTSDSTRRLEYAAIDAASRGVRGFFIRLVPDCILPKAARRTRFCEEGDGASDAGSVRRYRIPLKEEKEVASSSTENSCEGGRRPGLLRRLTSVGRK